MSLLSRRAFLSESAMLAAGIAALPVAADEKKQDKKPKPKVIKVAPNERIRVAVIGFHGRGMDHIRGFAGRADSEVVMICDPDKSLAGKGIKGALEGQDLEPRFAQDLRRAFDDKSIDVVSIATPNHWHALAAIWAIQAGKDVYVEKPVSHNISEGRRIVEHARKQNKIVQTGTQSRSNVGMRQAVEYLQSGKLGPVKLAYGLCYKPRGSIGLVNGAVKVPDSIDYDLWCGPAPLEPPHRNSIVFGPIHYDWHWFWPYGNGDLGNQGIHEMDKARWGLGMRGLPETIWSLGGRVGYVDSAETPNTQICFFDYPKEEGRIIFEVRGLKTDGFKGAKIGNVWIGPEGYMVSNSYSGGTVYRPDGTKAEEFKGGGDHYGNFLKTVKSRKCSDLNADIEEGHLSSALCHLGNISYRLGDLATNDELYKLFDNPKALGLNVLGLHLGSDGMDAVARLKEHLDDNHVDPAGKLRIGKRLSFDSHSERFKDNKDADALLTREYRKGFEVT
jgi:predicted dehydrogenase